MRVLFTNSNYQGRVEDTSLISVVPPLDLAYCAALVRDRHKSIHVEIVDANVTRLTRDALVSRIMSAEPDVVVVTAATYSVRSAGAVAGQVQAPGRTVILIGTHGTALPKQTLAEFPGIDVVVRGEPEWTVLDLVSALDSGRDLREVPGIVFRDAEKTIETAGRGFENDPDLFPFPARDLLPNHLYSSPYSGGVTALRTTRGCPGRCKFCDSRLLFGGAVRSRNPDKVADEVQECVDRFKTRYFAIMDHSFTADRNFVIQFCNALISRGLGSRIRWVCNTRVDMLDDAILAKMKAAGCLQIGIGMESAHDPGLTAMAKGVSENEIRDAIRRIKAADILVMGYTIIGWPDDTPELIELTRRKVLEMDPHVIQVAFATPLPGTALYRSALQENRVESTNWDDYVFLRKSILRGDHLSCEALAGIRSQFLKSFYLRPRKLAELAVFFGSPGRVEWSHVARGGIKVLGRLLHRRRAPLRRAGFVC